MNETIFKAIIRLFSIIASTTDNRHPEYYKNILKSFIKIQIKPELVEKYISLYEFQVKQMIRKKSKNEYKKKSRISVKILTICHTLNSELILDKKIILITELLKFIAKDVQTKENIINYISLVSDGLNINRKDYDSCKLFINNEIDQLKATNHILNISGKKKEIVDKLHIYKADLQCDLVFLQIPHAKLFLFTLTGKESLYLDSEKIIAGEVYFFYPGSSITSLKISPILYGDVVKKFYDTQETKLKLKVENIEFKFENSNNGIQKFSFNAESGQLIGIMGGSGVGKSTLLSILCGNLRPDSGTISLNGYDLYKNSAKLEGLIGFIPQDDLLINELSVYNNLYYNAKLCFGDLSERGIHKLIIKILQDLDLFEYRNLLVGDYKNKFISGGQRKRLNIALELIREPALLFVDEPTSGLSSFDSLVVMNLFKEQALRGKLVIANIHQPSTDIFKQFDKLLILDQGGFPIYYGNPSEAIVYFKTVKEHVDYYESECSSCGNINTDQILNIIEEKQVDEIGTQVDKRKITAEKWYGLFRTNIEKTFKPDNKAITLPKSIFNPPSLFKQFKVFSLRNINAKLSNFQYWLINFLEAPILAFILAYFTRFSKNIDGIKGKYLFSENDNIPAFLFMSIVVALFIGLTVSAKEIISDDKILKREFFLNLSRFSYINSKISFLFGLSLVQSLLYITVSSFILEINGVFMQNWIILFSIFCFANVLGLNISAGLNNIANIYILIPILLVPQLLLGGAIVDFDKLNKKQSANSYVPFVGDIMVARWGYEALTVNLFKNNLYQQNLFEIEKEMSNLSYKNNFLLSKIMNLNYECNNFLDKPSDTLEFIENLQLLNSELTKIGEENNKVYSFFDSINLVSYNYKIYENTNSYLKRIRKNLNMRLNNSISQKDWIIQELDSTLKLEQYSILKLKQKNHNQRITEIVTNRNNLHKIILMDGQFVQKSDPIYKKPASKFGRAHFYASEKTFLNKDIDTVNFNLIVIWLMNLVLYFTLLFNVLKKTIRYFEFMKFAKRIKTKTVTLEAVAHL